MKSLFNLSELDSVAKNLIDSLSIKIIRIDGIMGSGKTTLISQLMQNPQGLRLAVIVNEFGDVGQSQGIFQVECIYQNIGCT